MVAPDPLLQAPPDLFGSVRSVGGPALGPMQPQILLPPVPNLSSPPVAYLQVVRLPLMPMQFQCPELPSPPCSWLPPLRLPWAATTPVSGGRRLGPQPLPLPWAATAPALGRRRSCLGPPLPVSCSHRFGPPPPPRHQAIATAPALDHRPCLGLPPPPLPLAHLVCLLLLSGLSCLRHPPSFGILSPWIFNSGASFHTTLDSTHLTSLSPTVLPSVVQTADSISLLVVGRGIFSTSTFHIPTVSHAR